MQSCGNPPLNANRVLSLIGKGSAQRRPCRQKETDEGTPSEVSLNAALISFSASDCETLLDLNWELQRSQIPIAGSGGFTIRSLRFCMLAAYPPNVGYRLPLNDNAITTVSTLSNTAVCVCFGCGFCCVPTCCGFHVSACKHSTVCCLRIPRLQTSKQNDPLIMAIAKISSPRLAINRDYTQVRPPGRHLPNRASSTALPVPCVGSFSIRD